MGLTLITMTTTPRRSTRMHIRSIRIGECALFPLTGTSISTVPGEYNSIGFQLDQNYQAAQGMQDYYISRAAVLPSDIRIEALIYAQNYSFFVIPGEWFNPDPNDTNPENRPPSVANSWPL